MNPARRTNAPRGTRTGPAVLVSGLLAAASVLSAPAAHAADDFLHISLDGAAYGNTAPGTVFADGIRLVPGSASTGSVWVRNTGSEPAVLTAAVLTRSMDPELAGHLAVDASGSGPSATDAALAGPAGTCTALNLAAVIPAGGTREIALAAGLQANTPNSARAKRGSFDLLFVLESAAGGRPACDAAPTAPVTRTQTGSSAQTQLPANPAALTSLPGTAVVLVAGTPAAAGVPAALPAGPGAATEASGAGQTGAPPEITPAAFIESTVEPIIRTWQGTLMVLLTAGFFAAAAVRTRITRRTS